MRTLTGADVPAAVTGGSVLAAGGGGWVDHGYLVGETATPPRWTGPLGVEWAYRLLHDPRRLAGRYVWEPIRLAPWIAAQLCRARLAGITPALKSRARGRSDAGAPSRRK